jgi:murein DD-endopeptidase MepM/ murein hydrolase activator NlpD
MRYLTRAWGLALGCLLTGAAAIAREVPLRLDGEIAQGHPVVGHTDPAARVRFAGDPVRVSPDGVFLIGFGRDAPETQRLVVDLPDGPRVTRTLEIARRDYAIERIDGVPPETVDPPESALARIEREAERVRGARERDAARTDFLADFQWPLEGRITGVYGSQRVYNGEPRRPHYGIDIAADTGTPVRAPAPGRVTLAHPAMYFSGGTLILDHGHGLSSTFLHLSAISVDEGERIEQGQVIGRVGASGRATGPHLDWRINLFQRRLDPATLVGPMPASN